MNFMLARCRLDICMLQKKIKSNISKDSHRYLAITTSRPKCPPDMLAKVKIFTREYLLTISYQSISWDTALYVVKNIMSW